MRSLAPIACALALACTTQAPPEPQTNDRPEPTFEGTVGVTHVEREVPVATVNEIRTGRHEGYDRFVIELTSPTLPGYHVEYVDRPQHRCGSGEPVYLDGQAWLRIRVTPARMHTDAGEATVEARSRGLGYDNLLAAEAVCDFEGQVAWVLALRSPEPYRLVERFDPPRIYVDVKHPAGEEAAARPADGSPAPRAPVPP